MGTAGADYLGPPARLERLLPDVGRSMGEEWRASPALRGEVAIVRVRDVAAPDLRQKVANALQAQWNRDGEAFVLVRAKPLRDNANDSAQRLAKSVLEQCKESLRTEISVEVASDLLKPLQGAESASRWELERNLWEHSAQVRLLARILLGIGQDRLANALSNGRTVFTSDPNKMQRELPGTLDPALKEYVREQADWEVALEAAGLPNGAGSTVSSPRAAPIALDDRKAIRLVVSSQFSQAWVNLYAKRGGSQSVFGVGVVSQRTFPQDPDVFRTLAAAPKPNQPLLKIPEATKAYCDLVTRNSRLDEATDAARERMLDPVAHEPIAEATGDVLAAWADDLNANLVAHLPENLAGLGPYLSQGDSYALAQCTSLIRNFAGWETVPDEAGWLTPHATGVPLRWVDREVARAVIARAHKAGTVSLEDYALLVTMSEDLATYWPLAHAAAVAPFASAARHTGLHDGYRIVAALGLDLMARLRKGEPVTFAQLNRAQRTVVAEVAYRRICSNEQLGEDQSLVARGSPEIDPTDACPYGLPESAALTLRSQRWPRVATLVGKAEAPRLLRLLDRGAAARQFGTGGSGLPGENILGQVPAYETVAILRLTLTKGAFHEWDLSDKVEWPKVPPGPYTSLPAEFRQVPSEDGEPPPRKAA